MGKKHHEERSKRKTKHRQTEKSPKTRESTVQIEDTSSTNQEEMVFDMNDETDCVEVEIAEDSQVDILPVMTPTQSPKQSASKRSTPKQILPTVASANNNLNNANAKKTNKKRRDSGTSSEEERWLTAIESGKLDDVDDELKKMKDPKLMTARQRAMYERGTDKETETPFVDMLMSLPTGYREKTQTVEDDQKRILKIQKRKQLADEKREKDKQKTMDRLLNKKESNKQRAAARNKAAAAATKATVPMISYRNTESGAYVQLPPGVEFPLAQQKPREPPKKQLCGIAGCSNQKIYNCSKTNIPLCSLTCYRKNVQSIRQIMC